jgi:hypothetical protein
MQTFLISAIKFLFPLVIEVFFPKIALAFSVYSKLKLAV